MAERDRARPPRVKACHPHRAACLGTLVRMGASCSRARSPGDSLMALLRRALVALGLAGIIAAVLRLRGSGGTPPQQGGWRELSGPELE